MPSTASAQGHCLQTPAARPRAFPSTNKVPLERNSTKAPSLKGMQEKKRARFVTGWAQVKLRQRKKGHEERVKKTVRINKEKRRDESLHRGPTVPLTELGDNRV